MFALVADEIVHVDVQDPLDRDDLHAVPVVFNAERLVQPEAADAVFFVKLGDRVLHLRRVFAARHLLRERADPVPDAAVVDAALPG